MNTTNFEIWDGDLYLYTVHTEYESMEAEEAGFRIVAVRND